MLFRLIKSLLRILCIVDYDVIQRGSRHKLRAENGASEPLSAIATLATRILLKRAKMYLSTKTLSTLPCHLSSGGIPVGIPNLDDRIPGVRGSTKTSLVIGIRCD